MNTMGRYKTAALSVSPGPRPLTRALQPGEPVAVALTAAIFAVRAGEPVVAVVPAQRPGEDSLPCGPFRPSEHRTLESGVATWVRAQTGIEIGVPQQLCTFADGGEADPTQPTVSVSYLALVGPGQCSDRTPAAWRSWYAFLPWEDWRHGRPECLGDICGRLEAWAAEPAPPCATRWPGDRPQRVRMAFGTAGAGWDEEKVLERYELLQEAGLMEHGGRDGAAWRAARLAHPSLGDQATVLARAVGELRRALKWRPVLFELMPDVFTLFELQRTVEAILGPHLHKQNFRRLVEGGGLVEPTGEHRLRTGGRPARLYRFRCDVLYERTAPGVRVKPGRA
jgi:hypothetical protein